MKNKEENVEIEGFPPKYQFYISLVLCFQFIFHPLKGCMMILRQRCEKLLLPAQRDDGLVGKAKVLVLR